MTAVHAACNGFDIRLKLQITSSRIPINIEIDVF